jgi:hypothetical protein
MRLKISTELGEKIRTASEQAGIPEDKLIPEAIRRGMEFLERARS